MNGEWMKEWGKEKLDDVKMVRNDSKTDYFIGDIYLLTDKNNSIVIIQRSILLSLSYLIINSKLIKQLIYISIIMIF